MATDIAEDVADHNLTIYARMITPAMGMTVEEFKADWRRVSYGMPLIHSEKQSTQKMNGSFPIP